MTTEESIIRQRADDALYENLLRCLAILEPLDTQGSTNTLIDLCEKAMSLINEPVAIQTPSREDRQFLINILAETGYKVWVETREISNQKAIFVCFQRKDQK